MARKKRQEEPENLERWLVSYGDFITLLFATFVVLYALAQSDVNTFKNIEDALKKAFSQNIFDNQDNILECIKNITPKEYKKIVNEMSISESFQKYSDTNYRATENNLESIMQIMATEYKRKSIS